ncbi:putative disease resistance protein At4g27220 [Silene latifolia]|uniref:putative disease resistance protein At4g27220 n=1 Tax=Silene latifolia TaxID=37657 RepID=UPI003D776A28
MVEVSDVPDIARIQRAIAESIDLPLHDVNDITQRATRLYNRLISEKEKKVLIILDNVWKRLSLDDIGIPHTCKILLTTREKDVCRVMGVQDANIIKVGLMNKNESRELFKSHTGNQVDIAKYRNVVERLLSKCGGLPLAIVATANSLKDKDLYSWQKFANELEKPISGQVTGDYRHIYSILDTSYNFIDVEEKRIFFLLASLSPLGSSISIESLIRYGIGLNLFQHVNKLCEAMEQAATWVNELMLSSMLLEGDVKGNVKIHDIVRAFAISFASKGQGHKFMVEGIPRWLDDKTFKEYTAMSLTSKNDYSRLSGVEACKLQILILKGDLVPNFDDLFFNGMVNLEVLSLSNMNFQPSLPKSLRQLKELRTLCMEGCRLGNIGEIGELVNLLVLSLRGSSMENIPNEVGNLRKLRILDLGGCMSSMLPLIPTSVLNKFSTLEGLYICNERQSVLEKKSQFEEANAIVNIRLPYLNALEMNEEDIEELSFDGQTIKNLDNFRICLGIYGVTPGKDLQNFWRALDLAFIDDVIGFLKISCVKVLLKKADYLKMSGSRNLEDVIPLLDQEGFRSLRSLHLHACDDIKCIIDGRTLNNMIIFPCLQSLTLGYLESLEIVCNADVSRGSFSNLQTIKLSDLNELRNGLPLVPRTLEEIQVFRCEKLEFIFIEDEEVLATDLPFLKTLELDGLVSLLSLVGPKEFSNSYDALQGPRYFFGGKIGLPSLEEFKLASCDNVGKLWSKDVHTPAFQNLKDIQILSCQKLSSVGSPSVFSNLLQLENLYISGCNEMHEVISHEEIEESEIGEQSIVFPQLKSLKLMLSDNLESFYRGRSKLEFPKLKTLNLEWLKSMKMFAKLENSSALFNEKIYFQCLEELKVISVNDEVTRLWDKQSLATKLNPAPMLRQLELGSSAGLQQIPSIVLENLSSLTLTDFHFQDGDAVFSSSNLGEKDGFVWKYSQLPNLEGLKVEGSESLKELFDKEDNNAVNDALTSFCGQVNTLELKRLPSLNIIPLHLFKSIASLTLVELKWDYLTSADVLDSLHQLEFLSIERCHNMKALVINVDSQIKLPRLKQLHLSQLGSCIGISSMPKKKAALILPTLETLVIQSCPNLEHFWRGPIFAPSLQDVSIKSCDNLQHLLVGNLEDTIELPSLRKVSYWGCSDFKSISTGYLTAHKLREVKLVGCYTMQCFFPGNQNHDGDLQLPSLEVVDIFECRNLHAFSLGRLVAPKLTQIRYDGVEYSMLPFNDLNHFLKEQLDDNDDENED